jgi:uncharacterized protein YoxC
MGPTAVTVALILFAVLVGAAIPVLYQAAQTLKSARQQIDALGPQVDRALGEITRATEKVNRLAATVEEQTDRLKPIVDEVVGIGKTVTNVRQALNKTSSVLMAVAPAFAAGFHALTALRRGRGATSGDRYDEPPYDTNSETPFDAPLGSRSTAPEDEHGH